MYPIPEHFPLRVGMNMRYSAPQNNCQCGCNNKVYISAIQCDGFAILRADPSSPIRDGYTEPLVFTNRTTRSIAVSEIFMDYEFLERYAIERKKTGFGRFMNHIEAS